jgi:hypothetical protein
VQFGTLRRAVATTPIASNSGAFVNRCLRPLLVRNNFGSVGVRHPLGCRGKASAIFEVNVDRSKRIRTCAWTTLLQRLARREAISRHGVQHPRYGDTNASWEDA